MGRSPALVTSISVVSRPALAWMGASLRIYSPGIISSALPVWPSAERLVYSDELCTVGKGRFDLDLSQHFRHAFHDLVAAQNVFAELHEVGHGAAVAGTFEN